MRLNGGNHLGESAGRAERSFARAGQDPILDIAGVSAVEILTRCEEIRHGGRARGSVVRRHAAVTAPPAGWRLLDLADLSDADFVWEAHHLLLGRSPSPAEADRRLGDLSHRSSRMETIVRLALSPEGRRGSHLPTVGVGLPALAAAAGAIEAAKANPLLAGAARLGEHAARSAFASEASRRLSARRLATTAAFALAAVVADRRVRQALASGRDPRRPGKS